MRPFLPFRWSFALLVFTLAPLLAEGAETGLQYVLRVFTLPKEVGMDLLAKNLKDRALYEFLMKEAKTNPAVLEKLLLLAADNHADAELHFADELGYPTEFDPQQMPQQLAIGDSALVQAIQMLLKPQEKPQPTPPEPIPPAKATADHPSPVLTLRHPANAGLAIISSITPTAFETALLGDGLMIAFIANKTAAKIEVTGAHFAGVQDFNGESLVQVSDRKVTSQLELRPNTPCFLGTFSTAQRTGGQFETKDTSLSLAFITARAMPLPTASSAPAAEDGADLIAHFEVISLPKAEASVMIEEGLDDAVFHQRLKAAVKLSTAKLETVISGRTTVGEACTLAATEGYRYGTEFDSPHMPSSLVIADDDLLADLRAGRNTGTGAGPAPMANPHNGGFGLMTTVTPTAFSTRELGTKVELEINREGALWSVKIKPELCRRIGERTYCGVTWPMFESQRLSTTKTMRPGMPCLLGTLSRPVNTGIPEGNQEDRTWFAFLKLTDAK